MTKKRKYRRKRTRKIPLAPTLGLIGTVLSARHPAAGEGDTLVYKLTQGNMQGALNDVSGAFLGVDANGNISWETIVRTWSPLAIGIGLHMTLGRFANKYLKKVPYVNI